MKRNAKIPKTLIKLKIAEGVKAELAQRDAPTQAKSFCKPDACAAKEVLLIKKEQRIKQQIETINKLEHELHVAQQNIATIRQDQPLPIYGLVQSDGLIVHNWRQSWKWISNWCFVLIAYISVYGIPPEIMALIPVNAQGTITAIVAGVGIIGRLINQSKNGGSDGDSH